MVVDILTPEQRSALMARIRGKDTKPELMVRRLAHRLGYRYRLHRKDLPGKPDLVFSGRKKVIFVHGCFWHRHEGCGLAAEPKSRTGFWKKKFEQNMARDRKVVKHLRACGWSVLVIWECETHSPDQIAQKIEIFLR